MQPEVTIYTKNWCGYCRAALKLLDDLGLEYTEIDVTRDEVRYQEMLERAEGRTTVPQIFIDGKGIGGYTELVRMVREAQQQQQ